MTHVAAHTRLHQDVTRHVQQQTRGRCPGHSVLHSHNEPNTAILDHQFLCTGVFVWKLFMIVLFTEGSVVSSLGMRVIDMESSQRSRMFASLL